MGSRRARLAAAGAAALLAAAIGVSTAGGASLRVLIRHTPNMTRTNRTARTIDAIVIHATEGHFVGSVRWLEEARSQGSAHFVVSRQGQIVQLVPVTDVAWHSGNGYWNLHSIGIEHEGWTSRGGFTRAEYEASAALVAYLAHRWGIPLDRRHIVGHDEVPDPLRPGHFGGVDEHRDPGRHWNWALYMALVRRDAAHPSLPQFVRGGSLEAAPRPVAVPRVTPTIASVPLVTPLTKPALHIAAPRLAATVRRHAAPTVVRAAPHHAAAPRARVVHAAPRHPSAPRPRTVVHAAPLHATSLPQSRAVVRPGATLHGSALWWSGIDAAQRWRRHVYRVDFLVDGRLRYTDNTWPFAFHRMAGLNTRALANGRHLLVVRAYGAHHYRTRKLVRVRVRNPLPSLVVSGVPPAAVVAGVLQLDVTTNARERVALYVDGKPVSRDAAPPYTLSWDTATVAPGPHVLLVYGRDRFGHRTARTVPVDVVTAPSFPAALGTADLAPDAHTPAFGASAD